MCLAPKHRPLVPSTFPTPARSTLPACLSPSARRPHQSLGLKFHRERENRNFDRARCPALDCPRASTAARGRSGRRDVGTTDTRVITSPLTVELAMPHVRAHATARGGARRKKRARRAARGKRNTIERISGSVERRRDILPRHLTRTRAVEQRESKMKTEMISRRRE